jgi:AcrR family transcriptional regulator
MLQAASDLLRSGGMAAVTHQAVAQAAGVGRATVYRHWPKPLDLMLATLANMPAGPFTFGDGSIRDEIYRNFFDRIKWFNQTVAGTVIGALVSGAEHDAAIAQIRDGLFGRFVGNIEAAIAAAVTRGELAAGTPAHTIAAMITGTIMFERHMLGSSITPEMLAHIIDTALMPWFVKRVVE